uniref:Mothers against decapentaplegic homolog n=1 Tax=Heterorhabditis bacteriophora TaxID=37862 RepID=A0A1I7XJ04_HETBA
MNGLLPWHGPAVKKLLGWRRGEDEEKWAERAVEALVSLFSLLYKLICLTFFKVSHKKGLPHMIYCRVWRWPDLQSHQELRPIPECLYPHDNNNKSQHICINPYHYQRIDHHRTNSYPYSIPQSIPSPSSSSTSTCSPSSHAIGSSSSPMMMIGMGPSPSPMGRGTDFPPQPITSAPCSSSLEYPAASPSVLSEDGDTQMRQIPSPVSRMMPTINFWGTIGYYELNTRVGELFKVSWTKIRNTTYQLKSTILSVKEKYDECWQVYKREITVDGFTDPTNSDDRICLGLISNVNRNSTIENTRRHIGKGIRLIYTKDNNLNIENLSESSIFVQSRNCNFTMHQPLTTVCRVPARGSICVYNHDVFYHMLQRARQGGVAEMHALQKVCFIRLSFVKGWGSDYPRQDVTSTPCWVEIQLHLPLSVKCTLSTMKLVLVDRSNPTICATNRNGCNIGIMNNQ